MKVTIISVRTILTVASYSTSASVLYIEQLIMGREFLKQVISSSQSYFKIVQGYSNPQTCKEKIYFEWQSQNEKVGFNQPETK